MEKTVRKIMIVVAAALMVMVMAVPSFADTISVNVHFETFNGGNTVLYDKWGYQHYIVAKDVVEEVTFDTDDFETVIPGATDSNHQYNDEVPTAMDAIYQAYLQDNNSSYGWQSFWDTAVGTDPFGCYVTKIYNNDEVTQTLTSSEWKGYTWLIFMNLDEDDPSFVRTWNDTTNSGCLETYASNYPISDGENIYVRYMYTTETF